jgi:hypothetical protein
MKTAIKFLRLVRPRGPWTVTAIHPEIEGAPTRTFFKEQDIDEMRAWLANKNKTCGIYFCANPVRNRLNKRPSEKDISHFQYIALDFDPAANETPAQCQARVRDLLAWETKPTFVWNTGNGVQAMWRIRPAVELNCRELIADCKLINRAMVKKYAADSTISLEHIFRLPGTTNFPNATKRALGRKTVMAGNFTFDKAAIYDADYFDRAKAKQLPKARGLKVPIGGWDRDDGIAKAVLYLQTTSDLAREGVSGTALRTALKARDCGVSADMTFDLMMEHWVPRCEYEWNEDELRSKIDRAYKIAVNDPGCLTVAYAIAELEGAL